MGQGSPAVRIPLKMRGNQSFRVMPFMHALSVFVRSLAVPLDSLMTDKLKMPIRREELPVDRFTDC
jgi:hypothetical protein